MQPLLNASKAWQTIPTVSLRKREPSKKHPKNKLCLVAEVGEPKTNSAMKPKRWNNFIVKVQIWNINIIRVNHKKINMKNKQLKTEQLLTQTFSAEKIQGKSHKKFSTILIHILSYTENVWAVGFRRLLHQMNFLLPWLCVGLTVIITAWAEFKSVLLPEFFGHNNTYIYWVLE